MPKSTPHNAGNVNLRGKKCKLLRCGCCEAYDLRGDYETTRVKKEELSIASPDDGYNEFIDRMTAIFATEELTETY